jgi:hypothetical protein
VPDEPRIETRAVRLVMRRAAPRLVRDAFGPLAVFFTGWKLIGLVAGIALATAFGLAVLVHERRQGRPAAVIRLALLLVLVRAGVGLGSGSATAYLGLDVGIDVLLGTAVLGSLATSRPFAAWFIDDIYPLPAEVRASESFRRAMRTITVVWGSYFLARALGLLAALLTLDLDTYVLVAALSGAPMLLGILTWSVLHSVSVIRHSEHWERLLAEAETLLGPAAAVAVQGRDASA